VSATAQQWLSECGNILVAFAMSYSVAAWLAASLRRTASQSRSPALPPVTVLKPLCGAERRLYDSLRSFCTQTYPSFQIVFGAHAPDDPAIAVVHRLQREFPELDLQISVNTAQHGSSGKVSNLINMLPLARHDYLVVADSDIRVAPEYLAKIVPPLLDPEVGIVTCPYRGIPPPGPWGKLGAAFINDWFMPSVYFSAMLGSRAFAFGATIAVRREVLTHIGDFRPIVDQLADDYRLGELTRRMGLRTVLSDAVVETSVAERTFTELVHHGLRWLRTIRAVRPLGYAFSFISFGLVPATVGTLLAGDAKSAEFMLAITAAARLLLHFASRPAASALLELWVLPACDLLVFVLWCWGFVTSRVRWRDVLYRVARDGSAHRIFQTLPYRGPPCADEPEH
jgi:ceramide glucosyltransferase